MQGSGRKYYMEVIARPFLRLPLVWVSIGDPLFCLGLRRRYAIAGGTCFSSQVMRK